MVLFTTSEAIIQPLADTRVPRLRTGGMCCSQVLLPACHCWRQL